MTAVFGWNSRNKRHCLLRVGPKEKEFRPLGPKKWTFCPQFFACKCIIFLIFQRVTFSKGLAPERLITHSVIFRWFEAGRTIWAEVSQISASQIKAPIGSLFQKYVYSSFMVKMRILGWGQCARKEFVNFEFLGFWGQKGQNLEVWKK